jgi:predicted secreted protein
MAAANGRELKILKNNVAIAGVRTKTVAIAGAPIDITSDDDLGFRTMLGEAGTYSIDLTVEGVTKDDELRAVILAGGSLLLTDITIEYPDGGEISGDFFLASVEDSGEYADALTFSASLQSSGAWTYVPAGS